MKKTYKLVANISIEQEIFEDGDWVDAEPMFIGVALIDDLIKKLQQLRSEKEETIDGYWPPVESQQDLEIILEEGIYSK